MVCFVDVYTKVSYYEKAKQLYKPSVLHLFSFQMRRCRSPKSATSHFNFNFHCYIPPHMLMLTNRTLRKLLVHDWLKFFVFQMQYFHDVHLKT